MRARTTSADAEIRNGVSDRVGAHVFSRALVLLFSVTSGLAVANVYYAQPLLDAIADDFAISRATAGIIMTVTHVGYGLGLVFLVPLGDLLERRRLVVIQSLLSALALTTVALAPTSAVLLAGMAGVGFLAVIAQVMVAYAAIITDPAERGRIVGFVTSGIVVGILLARAISGTLSDLFGWRAVYLASAAATIAIATLLFWFLPRHRMPRAQLSYPRLIVSTFRLFAEERILRIRGMFALLIFAAVTVLLTPMVLPLAAPPFSLSHTQIGLFGLAGAAGALGASQAGGWSDRGYAQLATGVGLTMMLASWLFIALLSNSLLCFTLGVVIIDFALQAVHVTNQSLIYRVRPGAQSRVAAGYMMFYSVGSASGSILSTLVYAQAGWNGVCLLGAAISAAALALWWSTRR